MTLTLQTLSSLYSEHLWLELSDSDLEQAKLASQGYSNETGCNYAYLNSLCLNCFLNWLQKNLNLEVYPSAFPNEQLLPQIWEFVSGCGINWGNKRLVLIPSDAIDMADFVVSQEWVDIPTLAADYYLPIRVDLEERYLHVWGFVSRKTLKAKADYDPIYRVYYLEQDWVVPNLEVMELASNFCFDEKGDVMPLPKLSETEAKNLIEELSKPSPYSPRLKATFEKWGALLNESHWLQELYKRRVQSVSPTISALSLWLDGVLEAGWQTFEELFQSKNLAPGFRMKQVRGIELETAEKVRRAVKQLYNSQSEIIFPSHIEELDALVYLIQNTQDESLRWKAAEYLWTIAPNYPGSAMRRVMDLGVQLMGHPIALMVAVLRKLDGKVAVLLRAYPMHNRGKLPPSLRLIGLDENGASIPGLEAVARSEPQDDYISLYFSAYVGERFSVRLTLKDTSITEQFVV
ncbi:DUF1822 family protein [Allocoleopsis franciscana]|uniref:DUF1822 family protein n=1 Tax=Allocoleopsis franciscana PCC 7113 TaxID=1173027 RepID=K9WMR1_9CYAN|nr:DUF1822 family protein [Allocoleopsis franciscana]AFZ21488.1 Protein of unknown function (DUF1822) [Allocoleopsis franciscana PCC 7113]